eukprot:GFUD01008869.1.p1 GENE.GFUD01008869.1~~GFUD01008869.1.p1  ORF type:complete len:436 (-),score=88.02 GFUD01008869.1:436-1743(-)
MKVPVLLVIFGVTFMLGGQVSTSCSCSGYVTSKGRGECRTFYRGKQFCYVNPGQCSDQIKGSSSNRFWSYQACEKMEQQVSTSCSCSGYVTSKGGGECRTFYRGKQFCYVNPGQCSDQIKISSSNRFWSYQACEKMEQQCYTVRGNQCQFPFSYKGQTFSSCTTFDSENGAAWCTTTERRYEDCVSPCGVFSNSLASCPRNPVIKDLSRNCCTEDNPCGEGEGDCDTDNQDTCQSGLRCGDSNCGDFNPANYAPADCCYKPMIKGGPIICDDELKTLHASLNASNNTTDIDCCENGMTTSKTTCGNGTDCVTVCGVIPTCAKVVTDPEEGKDYCSNSYQMVIFLGTTPPPCSSMINCNALLSGTSYSCHDFKIDRCHYSPCNDLCVQANCADGTTCPPGSTATPTPPPWEGGYRDYSNQSGYGGGYGRHLDGYRY